MMPTNANIEMGSSGDKTTFDGVSLTGTDLADASLALITSNESAGAIGSTSDIAA